MKAVVQYEFGSPDVLMYTDIEIPKVSSDEVLIRGVYTSVNYADVKNRIGTKAKGNFPFTLGLDLAGIIEEAPVNSRFKKGMRVIAFPKHGTYAEFAVAKESLVFEIPDAISFEQAAAMPTVTILSYILLHEIAQVKKEDTIVIHSASGGVGSMLVQLAKVAGVQKIIGTVGNEEKISYVKKLGADFVFTYEKFSDRVQELTNQQGANVIFDSIAGEITKQSLDCLTLYGTLVQFGNSSGKAGVISTNDVHSSCRNIKGFSLGTTRKYHPDRLRSVVKEVFQLMESKDITVPIGAIFELSEPQKAHEYIESRNHRGKILIKIGEV